MPEPEARRVLVTGASGYIGGRLVSELVAHGHQVRCVARTPRKLDPAPWRDQVEVVQADIADDLTEVMADIATAGEPVDFWRVEDIEDDRRLVLHAEMRLPGEAWLSWSMEPVADGTLLVQTARYRPRGLFGRAYWYVVAPFHGLVFPGLLKGIARDAEGRAAGAGSLPS